jgi:hypothetical protein
MVEDDEVEGWVWSAGEEQEGWAGLADEALISPLCAGEAFEMRCGLSRRYDETGVSGVMIRPVGQGAETQERSRRMIREERRWQREVRMRSSVFLRMIGCRRWIQGVGEAGKRKQRRRVVEIEVLKAWWFSRFDASLVAHFRDEVFG